MSTIPVTVLMLTLNEEHNLPGALQNVAPWATEVFVVDSLSTDRTVDIALEHGAQVVQRPFTNFGDQWNFALSLPISTPWTLKLDPDERLTPELVEEIRALVEGEGEIAGYSMRRRLWFMGEPLHVMAPVVRLWRTGKCEFSPDLVNEHPIVDGEVGSLAGVLEHLDSPDLHHWYEKQNRYSTMEAIMMAKRATPSTRSGLLGNCLERRALLKRLFFKVPFRYQIVWLHCMFAKGAWRDGTAGRAWSHLRQEVYRSRALKLREIETTGRVPQIPRASPGEFDSRVIGSALQLEMSP